MNNYKVLLVEDEVPARTVFRHMIEERDDLFTLIGEAEDGREGLELFLTLKPQLIVTDITMPGMNGLEMLHEIEQSGQPQPQIVILTCHQDFHYAQQAIHLKASAYLIKDDCLTDPSLLARTLEELANKVVSEDETREQQQLMEQKLRSNEIEIEQSRFLEMLRDPASEAKWVAELEAGQLPVTSGSCGALLLEFDRSTLRFPIDQLEELRLWQFAGVNVLKELLGNRGANKVIALDKGRFLAVYAAERTQEDSGLLEQVLQAFSAYLKMNCFALQGSLRQGAGELCSDLKRLALAPYPFFYRKNASVTGEQWEQLNGFRHIPERYSRFWVKVLKQALLEPYLSAAALEQERSSFYGQAVEHSWDPEQIKSIYLRIFLDISPYFTDAGGGADVEAAFRRELGQCQSFDSVHDCVFKYFRKLQLLQGDGRKMDLSISRMIQRMREDLSYPYKLEEMAVTMNYSVPYFSSMFKKATGESFMQYLTRIRVEKAKLLLLTTDLKTFEIAEAIGFENYRSFNRIFKKEAGVTPSDFRKNGTPAD
jgi:two-component system, response regulator YesN